MVSQNKEQVNDNKFSSCADIVLYIIMDIVN